MAMGLSVLLAIGAASASVPTSNELGVHFKVLRTGATATIEVRLSPRSNFDSVAIEAASGVASLTSSCAFTNAKVVAGASYVCQVDLTGAPSEAAMTLNVIARRSVPGGTLPVMEVHHLSVRNTAFALSQKSAAASHHNVADTPSVHK
jgi:hypothetical protein